MINRPRTPPLRLRLQRARLEEAEGMADEEPPQGDEDLGGGDALAREEVGREARALDHTTHGVARTRRTLAALAWSELGLGLGSGLGSG
jgi:hypothetical protein